VGSGKLKILGDIAIDLVILGERSGSAYDKQLRDFLYHYV
jgi:hypothetical protein